MTTKCLPKKAISEKNQPKISFFTKSEKENPLSEDGHRYNDRGE
jgi:hypothetical protein